MSSGYSPNNLLNVPGQFGSGSSSHTRSSSFGSTGTSGWTGSPSTTAMEASDIGEDKSEIRQLLRSDSQTEIPDNPFAFTPKQLAKLHDPKDLNILRAMGGMEGLVFGLRTDVEEGLSPDEDVLEGKVTLQDVWHELETRRKERYRRSIDKDDGEEDISISVSPSTSARDDTKQPLSKPESAPTAPTETVESKPKDALASRRATNATVSSSKLHTLTSKGFSDRKRIFDENRIPTRKPKNIFQLMWMALHDKILV
jgi:P-type Ca2+ transporter type 2C